MQTKPITTIRGASYLAPTDGAEAFKVTAPLAHMLVRIDSVQRHPANAHEGDVASVAASLDEFAQQKPIIVQASTNWIVAGNTTHEAAELNGWTHIAASIVDLDDTTARGYMLADNRTSDLGGYNEGKLAILLEAQSIDGALAGTGYDQGNVEDLMERLAQAELKKGSSDGPPPGDKISSYDLIFDDEEQADRWQTFLRFLAQTQPGVTTAERLDADLVPVLEDFEG